MPLLVDFILFVDNYINNYCLLISFLFYYISVINDLSQNGYEYEIIKNSDIKLDINLERQLYL